MANDLVLRVTLDEGSDGAIASGGQITYDGQYVIHTFTSSANFVVEKTTANTQFQVLLVGAGGKGGDANFGELAAGGGGGGGEVLETFISLGATGSTFPVVIGNKTINNGFTTFAGLTAVSGGNGGNANTFISSSFLDGNNGGSGGGGGTAISASGGGGTAFFGNSGSGTTGGDGGAQTNPFTIFGIGAGGGGGAQPEDGGSITGVVTYGIGGDGKSTTIRGTTEYFGGGGGGGMTITAISSYPCAIAGGIGGGGCGAYDPGFSVQLSITGSTNTGGGGGGGVYGESAPIGQSSGSNGGSGITIIKYLPFISKTYDLDTPSDIDFRVDLSAIENTEIGSIFGIASQVFELPSSKTNDEFFSAAFNVNSTSVKGLKNSVDCQVLVNGGEIFKGNLILQEVITDGNNNTQYSVEVVNETIDFQTLIQDQYISDLDFSDYNHNYTMASITSSWTGSLASGNIVYPLVDYGVDSTDSTLPLIELGGVTGKMDSVNTPLKTIQFKPAIRAKALIDTMFDSVGYRYSSSFFDSTDFNNIYVLPTSTDKLGIQSQASQDAGFYVTKTSSQTFADSPAFATLTWEAEQWDPSTGFNLATDTFTVQTAGAYAFKLQLNISAPDGTGIDITQKEFTVRVKVNGGSTFAQSYSMIGNTSGIMTFVTPGQVLNAGDTVSVDARYRMDSDGTTPAASINNLLTFFQTVYAPTALIGGNVNMAQQFEEQAKSLDFLKGIIQMFNLVVEPKKDSRKTLIIEPFDTWRNSGVIKDWTTKFDSATKISIKHPIQDQPRNLIHKLEDDDDSLNVFSKQQFDREYPYGTNFYTADSDIAQGDKVIGSFFAPTPTKSIGGGNNIIIPHLYKSDAGEKKPIKFKPRLLYLIPNRGTIDAVGGKIFVRSDTGLSVGKTSYPTLNHLSSLPADDSTTSLHFNANKWYPYHNNFAYGYTINGLFNEYWGRYINELYDDDARVMTCNIYFDPYELPTIQLNDKIFIKDAYYRINKISGFNLSKKESVQVELLKAAVSQFAFKRHRGVRVSNIKTADLTLSSFNTISGQATYVDINTGETYASGSFLKNIAKLDSLAFEGDKAVFTPAFNLTLQTDGRNALDGNFNQDQSIGYALGNITEGTIGKDVDRAIAVGSNINLQQNVRSALTIGDNLTVGSGSTFATILNSDGGNIINENNYGFIIGGSGSSIAGGDYVGVINSELSTVRESDYTTLINGHTNEVVVNGSGHLVLGLNNEGAGLDLLNYRGNSNYLGDTYNGGAIFSEAKTLTCGDGTTINLYDTQYKHDNLFILNWSGLSPGTTTINLPSLTNDDYEKIIYRIKANGTFDGTTKVNFIPFTSPQTIQGFTSASFSSSYDYIELYANGTDWLVLDGGGSISISGSGGGGGSTFPFTGAALISGSLTITGSVNVSGSVTAKSFLGDGSGLTNLPSTSANALNKFYEADTFTFDIPGDTTATPVDIHVSQSGVYFISCSGVPAGVAGPRVNVYYWPELLGNNETAKLKIEIPAGDTLTGFTYKTNVTASTNAEWIWYSTISPSATGVSSVGRNTTFKRMYSLGTATMVKDGSGRAFFLLNNADVNANMYFHTGSSVNPLV